MAKWGGKRKTMSVALKRLEPGSCCIGMCPVLDSVSGPRTRLGPGGMECWDDLSRNCEALHTQGVGRILSAVDGCIAGQRGAE